MRTKHRAVKRSITLFEVLIVMSLIAIALGSASLPLSRALKGARFEKGVDQMVGRLELAQEVMLDFHTDVQLHLNLDESNKELLCTLKASRPLPPRWVKAFNRYVKIKGIDSLAFNNEIRSVIELQFDSTPGTTPKGTLTLYSQGKEKTLFLKGYPAHIKRGDYEEKEMPEAVYPQEILSAL